MGRTVRSSKRRALPLRVTTMKSWPPWVSLAKSSESPSSSLMAIRPTERMLAKALASTRLMRPWRVSSVM